VVGGTTLATAGPGGPWLSEIAWNAQEGTNLDTALDPDTVAASGGGISTVYSIPTWQHGVNMSTNQGSATKRNSPDVAMVADNIFIVADDGQEENTGGTSAAAPLWAGFAALVNQQAVADGVGTIGFVNPALYNIGTNFSYAACFDDITKGNTTNTVATQFVAVPGYDLCTGLGSPAGSSLINSLTKPDGFTITPGRGVVANGPAGGPFTVSSQSLSLTNIGKPAFNWSAGSSAPWLNLSRNQGALASTAGATVTLSLNSSVNALPSGLYTANVWFTNLTSGLVQLRQFTVQVSQELVQDGGFEAGDFTYWPLTGPADIFNNNFVDFSDDTSGADYPVHSGQYFAALGEIGSLSYLSQCLPTRAGQYYLLSFWLANPAGATPNQFQVQWNQSSTTTNIIFNQLNLGDFDYSNFVFTVQATTNMTTLKFGSRNDQDFFILDDISVLPQPVPAPAIVSPHWTNGAVQFSYVTETNVQYQVQYRTNLVLGSWINVGGVITAATNPTTFTDTASTNSQRFYRVELVP
jgi:kumamolisin